MILICILALAVMLGLMAALILRKKLTAERFFAACAVPLAIVYLVVFPPWSVPDAESHFTECYRYSNLLMGRNGEQEWIGRKEDAELFLKHLNDNPGNADFQRIRDRFHWGIQSPDESPLPAHPEMNWYSIVNYLPQVLGLTAGRLLGLGSVPTLYLSRILITLVYLSVSFRCVRNTPTGKCIFALIPLFPVSIMLGTSFSYDAMVLVTALPLTVSVLRLRSGKADLKTVLSAAGWFFLAGSVKGGCSLLLFPLLFLIPLRRHKDGWKQFLVLFAAGLLSLLLFDLLLPQGGLFQMEANAPERYSASFAFSHPLKYAGMVLQTYAVYGYSLLIETVGAFLGHMEGVIPGIVVLPMLFLPGFLFMLEDRDLPMTGRDRLIIVLTAVFALLLIPVTVLSWTPLGSSRIEGLQGRYFLPFLPAFCLLLPRIRLHGQAGTLSGKLVTGGYAAFALLSCVCVFFMLRLYGSR